MITAFDLRSRLNYDAKSDNELTTIALMMIGLFESRTRRKWNARTGYVQIFQPDQNDKYIWTDLYPMTRLVVTEWWQFDMVNGNDVSTTGLTSVPAVATIAAPYVDYQTYAKTGRIELVRANRWKDYVQLTVDGGYTATTCPLEIKEALIIQAMFMKTRMGLDKLIAKSQSGKGGSISYMEADYHPFFVSTALNNMRNI